MAWNDRGTLKGAIDRDARIARRVMALLRAEGFTVQWLDSRTPGGLRLYPANLRSCGHDILCRPIGYRKLPGSTDAACLATGALLQLGASDIAQLVQSLKWSRA